MGNSVHIYARLHRWGVIAAAVVFAAVLAVAIGLGSASAAPKTTILGAAKPATPACPDECQAIGRTTGFQTAIGRKKDPFVYPNKGRVVAWSIKLAAPTAKQIAFFDDFFGGAPAARIAVLKPINKQIKRGRMIYKLKSQGPIEDLTPFFGRTTTFTLQKPLVVKKNWIVALTVPTWAPAFAVNLGNKAVWRASRKKGKCNKADDIKAGRAAQGVGKDRIFGCAYKTARLLYSATVVRTPSR